MTKHQEASNLTFPVVPAIVFGLAWMWIQMCRHHAVFPGFRVHFNACPDFDSAASNSRLGQEDREKKDPLQFCITPALIDWSIRIK